MMTPHQLAANAAPGIHKTASDEAGFLTGTTYLIDGGDTAQ